MSRDVFAGGGSRLQFVTITASGKCDEVKRHEPEVCVCFVVFSYFVQRIKVLSWES